MALISVKWNTTVNKFPEMQQNIAKLNGKRVEVGARGENAWLAAIHEYGCKIEVTDKMRAYLHSQGLHLKKDTKYITIPERGFLRNGYDEHKDDVISDSEQVLGDVISGSMGVDAFLNMVGILLSSKIKDYARDLGDPANHPFTIKRKGSSNPLIGSTGEMIGSISHEVK